MLPYKWYSYYNIVIIDETEDVCEEAKRIAQHSQEEFVIWSKSQKKSFPRADNKWISGPGNLYIALILRPEIKLHMINNYLFILSVSVAEFLKKLLPNEIIEFKWPNDIYVNNKKIATVRIEPSIKKQTIEIDWLVGGLAINVKSSQSNQNTSSINQFMQENIEIEFLLDELMKSAQENIDLYCAHGFQIIRKKWLKFKNPIGENIIVKSQINRISGKLIAIEENGAIKLKLACGEVIYVNSGEIFLEDCANFNLPNYSGV